MHRTNYPIGFAAFGCIFAAAIPAQAGQGAKPAPLRPEVLLEIREAGNAFVIAPGPAASARSKTKPTGAFRVGANVQMDPTIVEQQRRSQMKEQR